MDSQYANFEAEKVSEEQKHSTEINLKKQFSTSNSHAVWQGLQHITQYKQKPTPENNDPTLPDQLNHFYSRFDRKNTTKASSHSGPTRLCPQTQIQVSHHLPSLPSHGR